MLCVQRAICFWSAIENAHNYVNTRTQRWKFPIIFLFFSSVCCFCIAFITNWKFDVFWCQKQEKLKQQRDKSVRSSYFSVSTIFAFTLNLLFDLFVFDFLANSFCWFSFSHFNFFWANMACSVFVLVCWR